MKRASVMVSTTVMGVFSASLITNPKWLQLTIPILTLLFILFELLYDPHKRAKSNIHKTEK